MVKVPKIESAVWTSIRVVARSTDGRSAAREQHRASNQSVLQASGSAPLRWKLFGGNKVLGKAGMLLEHREQLGTLVFRKQAKGNCGDQVVTAFRPS